MRYEVFVMLVVAMCGGSCAAKCSVDLMYIQDVTSRFGGKQLATIKGQARDAFRSMARRFTSVRFGVASFSDKPIEPFGDPMKDFCYREDQPLKAGYVHAAKAIESMRIVDGGDALNSQLDAIFFAAVNANWRVDENVSRVIVLVTNSGPHTPADGMNAGLIAHPGDDSASCNEHTYASIQQVNTILQDKGIMLLILSLHRGLGYIELQLALDVKTRVKYLLPEGLPQMHKGVQELIRDDVGFCDQLYYFGIHIAQMGEAEDGLSCNEQCAKWGIGKCGTDAVDRSHEDCQCLMSGHPVPILQNDDAPRGCMTDGYNDVNNPTPGCSWVASDFSDFSFPCLCLL